MPDPKQVAVIGGGISGLACAYRLQQLGVAVTLLEATDRAGGLIGTVEKDGFLFESGPQSFQGTEQMLALIRELGIEASCSRPIRGRRASFACTAGCKKFPCLRRRCSPALFSA